MKIIYHKTTPLDPDQEKELGVEYSPDLEGLLKTADFISVHVPLTPATHHLIGAPEFAMMKPKAVFVNTSRGSGGGSARPV